MIGSNLVKRLVAEGHDVTVIDNLWRGKLEYLDGPDGKPVIDTSSRFHCIDLSKESPEVDSIVSANEYVIHLADIVAGIDYVFGNQGDLFRQNNLINTNLFHSVRKAGKDRIKGVIYRDLPCCPPRTPHDPAD